MGEEPPLTALWKRLENTKNVRGNLTPSGKGGTLAASISGPFFGPLILPKIVRMRPEEIKFPA